ncbi:MAG: UTP--glucose-1-phosphate uridylyltransferase GalU [Candidatus Altiarchaeota archaeon]
MKVRKAVIPAAGLGTRFLPATKAQPKEMLPLVDKPAIQFAVEEAVASGIRDILIITGRGKRAIEDHFDRSLELEQSLKKSGKRTLLKEMIDISELADIHFIRQKQPSGLGHAILCAEKHVGSEPFAVMLGDDIVHSKVPCTAQIMRLHHKYDAPIIAIEEVPKHMIESYGIIDGEKVEDSVYFVRDLVEKPKPENAPSNLGIIGRYILTPEIFKAVRRTKKGKGGEVQLTDALRILNKETSIFACDFEGVRYDLGNKMDYLKATVDYALMRKDIAPEFRKYLKSLR